MKRVSTVLAAVLVLACGSVKAQHAEFGLKAGLNVANLHSSRSSSYDPRASVHAGGLVHIHITRYFALQPEIVFSSQGTKQVANGTDYTSRLNYLNFPLLAQFMVANGFRLQTGPQLGVLTSANYIVNDNKTDIRAAQKDVDFAWTFGASYITPIKLGFDARFNLGLSDISDDPNVNLQNRVFQVGLFYQFANHHRK